MERTVCDGITIGEPTEPTLVVRLGYRGQGFSGFAEQPGGRTVAGELRRALETCLRREVEMTCAGRTDAGVHALSQHVSVPLVPGEADLASDRLMRSLVALTPDDISIQGIYQADPGFSARFDALARSYRYRICAGAARPVLSWDHAWWYRGSLDADAMAEAARPLLGEHDFKSFCKASSAEGKPTCRFVSALDVTRVRRPARSSSASTSRATPSCTTWCAPSWARSWRWAAAIATRLGGKGPRSPRPLAAGPCAPRAASPLSGVSYPRERSFENGGDGAWTLSSTS